MSILTLARKVLMRKVRVKAARVGNMVRRRRMKVAFIGLGNMGVGMAGCILRTGYDLTVWNRTAAKAAPLVSGGAKLADSAAAAVKDADLVITSLMDDTSVLDMVNGELLGAMKPGAIHLCVTTISPECSDTLSELHREAGTRYVAGPVIGRPDAAAAGSLVTYLAGPPDAIETATPVCESYAMLTTAISDQPSIANCMKLIVNYAGVSIIEILGETYSFAEKSGIDLAYVQQFFNRALAHPALKMYAAKVRKRDYTEEVGFAIEAGLKDVRLMLSAAGQAGVAFDIGKIIERKMVSAISGDLAQADWSAICEVTRRESGLN